jgi:hypothetical protein
MKKFFKYLIITLLIVFVLMQLIPRPAKNSNTSVTVNDISITNKPSLQVMDILKESCYDCHSNNTRYPWYASIQPVAWWLGDHIKDGKRQLNYSEFGTYSLRKKYKKLEETIKMVEEDEMPLKSYTLIHTSSKLNATEKDLLINWGKQEMEMMRNTYNADSLLGKKKAR